MENIEYDILVHNVRMDRDRLDKLVELMGYRLFPQRDNPHLLDDYPVEEVKFQCLKLCRYMKIIYGEESICYNDEWS